MKKYTLLLLVYILTGVLWYTGSVMAAENKSVLNALRLNCSRAFEKRDFQSARKYSEDLMRKALSDTSSAEFGYANFYMGTSELFSGDSNLGKEYLSHALRIAERTHNDSLTGMALNCLGIYEANVNNNYYLAQHYFMRSLDYPDMEGSVSSNLAQIARLQRDSSGAEYARRCYDYGVSQKKPYFIYSGLISIAEFEIQREEYSAAEITLKKAAEVATREGYADRSRLDFLKGVILSHRNRLDESNSLLLAIHDTVLNRTPLYLAELEFVIGKNYEKKRDYRQSNLWLEKSLESSKKYSSHDYTGLICRQLSDNYLALGNNAKAIEYMTMAYDIEEGQARSERDRMSKERSLTLEVARQERERLEATQKMRIHRIVAFFLLCLLSAAVFIILYIIRSVRRRDGLYRHIVRRNVEFLHNTQDEESQSKSDKKTATPHVEKYMDLFNELESLMKEKELYRNPLLTREEVIEMLQTNSTYLSQCIKEQAGVNYSQYVNSYRIKAAVCLFSDRKLVNIPIKTLAEDAGFNSMTTFYKLFQEATGMSPSAYRKSLRSL